VPTNNFVKNNGVSIIMVDSDGNIDPLIPLLLEGGVNVIYPMEAASSMDVVASRKKYGKVLRYIGNIDKRALAKGKKAIQIGLAVIDRTRCLPWAGGGRCVICLDACPPDYAAIELRQTETGEFRPYVKHQLCTGCGICEYKCPVEGESAIRVVAVKEMSAAM